MKKRNKSESPEGREFEIPEQDPFAHPSGEDQPGKTMDMPGLPTPIEHQQVSGSADASGSEDLSYTAASRYTTKLSYQSPYFRIKSLREGCYLIRYTPLSTGFYSHYDGTLRVEKEGTNTVASGDLYYHRVYPFLWPYYYRRSTPEPNPANGIPVFSRANYRYYLRVTGILEWITLSNSFTLRFDLYRYNTSTNTWTNNGSHSSLMSWTTAPSGYPSSSNYLSGTLKNSGGVTVGNLTMGWVSSYLRRATLEIDTVSQSERPLNNGAGTDWQDIFDQVGWQVNVDQSHTNLPEPDPTDSNGFWSDAELHSRMLTWRDSANLDSEWRYHLLCVRRLDSTSRGIMYDAYGGDSNNIPREGAAISSHWTIPNQTKWGTVQGDRFGTTSGYFRTAVHEIGHAQGLYHNSSNNGFMNTTGQIAGSAGVFPSNITWAYHPDDQKRLRHMPDIWVRPGGVSFGSSYGSSPISPNDSDISTFEEAVGLDLEITPLITSIPIGAPVRINMRLTNNTDMTLPAPSSLSMKSGHVKGTVTDPSGKQRIFKSIIICVDEGEAGELGAGESMVHAVTLLRGPEGALFPSPGLHKISVHVAWEYQDIEVGVSGESSFMITPPVDDAHASAALKVLSTPDILPTVAIGGDHLEDGVSAIQAGMNNDVLRPHFAVIDAKRLGRRFMDRKAQFHQASELIDEGTIMTGPEINRAAELVEFAGEEGKGEPARQLVKRLHNMIDKLMVDGKIIERVKKL